MNELKQIRTMAEMILEKVAALEGANPEVKSKFQVGDCVQFRNYMGKLVQAPISRMAINDMGCHTKDEWNYHFDRSEHNCDTNFIPAGMMPEHELTKVERVWHSGPPPHVGWWNASTGKHPRLWRWWNGSSWSQYAHSDDDANWAHGQAMWVTTDTNIQWTDYWPANARVPRIDPTKV